MAWCGVCDIVCMVCCVWYGVGCEVWCRYEESVSCVWAVRSLLIFVERKNHIWLDYWRAGTPGSISGIA